MMSNTITFCENCRDDVSFSTGEKKAVRLFKDETIEFMETYAVCDKCGSNVFVAKYHDNNLMALNKAYRLKKGILSLEQILEIPIKYCIGKRPLSLLLNWGELTLTRYCDGDIPTKHYADTLKRIYDDPKHYLSILKSKKDILSPSTYRKSKSAVEFLLGVQTEQLSTIERIVKHVLSRCDDITNLALQKSLYYIQGFYFAFHNSFIFDDDCEAWIHGPVYREIYHRFSDYGYDFIRGESEHDEYRFSAEEELLINSIIRYFCCYSGKTLERFTHIETPWLKTRGDLPLTTQSNRIINKDLIGVYFSDVKTKYNMLTPADIKMYSTGMFEKLQ